MNCQDFQNSLHPYVDGELGIDETVAADVHGAQCPRCRSLVSRERHLRQLLRRQPRESGPPELRARIASGVRRSARLVVARRWLLAPGLAALAAGLVMALVVSRGRQPAPLVDQLVDTHIAYAQIEQPAEFASTDRLEVKEWFRQRAGFRVTVPDYSPSGIRLVGARIAVANEQKVAYLLYEKGRTLLSVFMMPASRRDADLAGTPVSYRGHDYLTREWKGYRTVLWTDGGAVFGLVSMLDYEALLACADRLRVERANQTRL
ncbi:MAG: zf-HC2 domain-containing protein [Candidatus Rokubacteria bacterium]|nr:zf-HC2 domain-containing protein [Candidatus Rokubacteria bacterium]